MSITRLNKTIREIFQTNDFIPLHEPSLTNSEKEFVKDCIDSTFVSSVGEYVNRVEEQLATITNTAKAAALVNGTSALQVGLRIVGVENGDEVLTQALTFVATANAITYNGATPVFIDVDIDTMGMSPNALEAWLGSNTYLEEDRCYNIKTGKKIAACMPMHTFGFICNIEEIITICNRYKIPVVEDAAEALGSFSQTGKSAGSFGVLGALSFNGNKVVTAGGGGAIISSNASIGEKAKYLTTTAKVPHPYEYVHDEIGYNFRMPNLNAALLSAQLERLNEIIKNKKETFKFLKNNLSDTFELINPPKGQQWNYWLFSLKADNKVQRNKILEDTNSQGIMTRPIWQLMYRLPMYSNCQRDDQKNAEYLEERVINIPSSVIKID